MPQVLERHARRPDDVRSGQRADLRQQDDVEVAALGPDLGLLLELGRGLELGLVLDARADLLVPSAPARPRPRRAPWRLGRSRCLCPVPGWPPQRSARRSAPPVRSSPTVAAAHAPARTTSTTGIAMYAEASHAAAPYLPNPLRMDAIESHLPSAVKGEHAGRPPLARGPGKGPPAHHPGPSRCCGPRAHTRRARLRDAALGPVVHVHQPEPLGVSLGPLEVVHQRPGEVAAHVRARLDRPLPRPRGARAGSRSGRRRGRRRRRRPGRRRPRRSR